MQKKKVLVGLLCLSLVTSTAWAADAISLGDEYVTVYGEGVSHGEIDTTINMDSYKGEAKSLPELLRGVAGIQVQSRAFGGGAEDLTMKLRGHDSRHFMVLVDGVPQKNAGVMGGSYFSWDALPFESIEKIEIIKGAKSVKYGQVNGGVINIVTKHREGGSYRRSMGTGKHHQAAFNYQATSGMFDIGVNFLYDAKDAVLRNADYSNRQYGFNLSYHINATDKLKVDFLHTRTNRGLVTINDPARADYNSYYPVTYFADAFGNAKDNEAKDGSRSIANRNAFNIAYESKRDKGQDFLSYWKVNERLEELKMSGEAVLFKRNNLTDLSQGYIYKGSRVLDDKHELAFGADFTRYRYGYGWYDSNAEGASAMYPSQKANVYGVYVGDTWRMNSRWTLDYGLRYDVMKADRDDSRAEAIKSISDSSLSPKINATWKHDDRTTTALSVNRIWRAPSMAEFYWYYQGMNLPAMMNNHNKEESLAPDKGWGYDIALQRHFTDKYDSKVSLFYQDYSSFISFVHTKPFNCYMLNGVKIWGLEWENSLRFDEHSSVYLNYTNQHTAKSGGRTWDKVVMPDQLDYRPRHILSLGYRWENAGWTLQYDMNYTGSQRAVYGYPAAKPTENRIVDLGGYAVHNLSLSKKVNKRLTVNLTVYNLFDKSYCEIYGYPMEGRNFAMTCTNTF